MPADGGAPSYAASVPASKPSAVCSKGGSRAGARGSGVEPSGTEPKIKFYLDLREPMGAGESVHEAQARAEKKMAELGKGFLAAAGVG